MTPLRKRMIEEMELRNFAPKTIKLYVNNVARFAQHFGKSPEMLDGPLGWGAFVDGVAQAAPEPQRRSSAAAMAWRRSTLTDGTWSRSKPCL